MVYLFEEMGYNGQTEMHLIFQDLKMPSLFETIPNVGGRSPDFTAANNVIIKQKFWVFSENCQGFAYVE